MAHRLLLTSKLVLALAASASASPAAGDAPPDEKTCAAEVAAPARREAEAYRPLRDDGTPLALAPESAFQWTDPVIGTVHVYLAGGRPAAALSIYRWYQPFRHRSNEWASPSTRPLTATREGRDAWAPRRPGFEFRPIPEAPEPAATPAARLRQMRDLAKDFAGRETTREEVDRDLRLLTQPIDRCDPAGGDGVGGALFVFAQATDPEAFLLIEARPVDGVLRWHYAPARMTAIAVRVAYKGREVWSAPTLAWGTNDNPGEPCTSIRFDP